MFGTADGLVVFEGPADLAVLNSRLPALFLADAKPRNLQSAAAVTCISFHVASRCIASSIRFSATNG
jgi:hypothetical protein